MSEEETRVVDRSHPSQTTAASEIYDAYQTVFKVEIFGLALSLARRDRERERERDIAIALEDNA